MDHTAETKTMDRRPDVAGRWRGWLGVLLVACLGGCVEERQVYEVRGRYLGPAFGGQAIRVDHEPIPGYMEAMEMTFRLSGADLLAGLAPGDKIAFRLVVNEEESYVEHIEALPPETRLELADPSTQTPAALDTLRAAPADSAR